jgi:hypothetical protein
MLRAMLPTDILYSPNPNTVNQLVPYAWPGTREDSFANCNCIPFPGLTSYTGTIGFGVTIGIPINTPEPSAIQASPGAHMLWKQMQTHGLMVRDSTHVSLGVLQLQTDQGVPSSNPLIQQMMQFGKQILSNARLLVNQGPNSINGGGTPVVPLIPPLRGANPPPPDVTIGTGASTHSRATGQPALTRSQ